jgi:hypothetical protein
MKPRKLWPDAKTLLPTERPLSYRLALFHITSQHITAHHTIHIHESLRQQL